MDKFEILKSLVGEKNAEAIVDLVKQREGEAAAAGLTTKEVAAVTEKDEATGTDAGAFTDETTTEVEATAPATSDADEVDETDVEELAEVFGEALTPLIDEINTLRADLGSVQKEYQGAMEVANKEIKALKAALTPLQATVKELTGDLPKASVKQVAASRATASNKNVTTEKNAGPAGDPEQFDFINGFLLK